MRAGHNTNMFITGCARCSGRLHAKCTIEWKTSPRTSRLDAQESFWHLGARHVEMRSVQEKTRTLLTIDEAKFNQHLDEKLFMPRA